MFGDLAWHTVAVLMAGVAITGLVLWVGLRNRQQPDAQRPKPADAPQPNLVSRIVSWTSMVNRGGYRGPTRSRHRPGGSVDVLITDPARAAHPVKGWVQERSVNTPTLVAEQAFDAGTIGKVRRDPAQGLPCHYPAVVARRAGDRPGLQP